MKGIRPPKGGTGESSSSSITGDASSYCRGQKSNAREEEIIQGHKHCYETILNELRELYKKKNHDYGNSFSILFQKFGLQSVVIRLWDKLLRLETLCEKEAQVKNESIIDTLMDLANYSIIAVAEMRKWEKQ